MRTRGSGPLPTTLVAVCQPWGALGHVGVEPFETVYWHAVRACRERLVDWGWGSFGVCVQCLYAVSLGGCVSSTDGTVLSLVRPCPRMLVRFPVPLELGTVPSGALVFRGAQGVEPTENKQDAKDVVPIPLILSAVFGAAITFFLILPNLPFTNPDQL